MRSQFVRIRWGHDAVSSYDKQKLLDLTIWFAIAWELFISGDIPLTKREINEPLLLPPPLSHSLTAAFV